MKSNVISGILAGIAFVVFNFILKQPFMLALIVGIAVYIGGTMIFSGNKKDKKEKTSSKSTVKETPVDAKDIKGADRLDKEFLAQVVETIKDGEKKVRQMREMKEKVSDFEVRSKIESIGKTLDKIFIELKNDPQDVKKAKKTLGYYLETTIEIIDKYISLSKHRSADSKIAESLNRVEKMLTMLDEAFQKQLTGLLENNVMDLDVEIEVLEQNLKSRGM